MDLPATGTVAKRSYTYLSFDINLAKANEEPIPLRGMTHIQAARFVLEAVERYEARCNGQQLVDYSAPATPSAGLQSMSRSKTQARFYVDSDGSTQDAFTPSLLCLPAEIRNMVYKLLVVPGQVYPHDDLNTDLAGPEKPYLSILRTNRQIHEEALSVYYSSNQFHIARGDPWISLDFLSSTGQKYITRLSVRFSTSDLCSLDRDQQEKELVDYLDSSMPDASRQMKNNHVHDGLLARLEQEIWATKGSDIAYMTALQHLTLDITDAYCPHKCCRMAIAVALFLTPPCKYQKWYRNIKVIGAKTEEERLKVLAAANGGYDALHEMEEQLSSGAMGLEGAEDEGASDVIVGFW